jgi:uncharacterized phage protein (TIGR02220 family)
MREYGSVHTCFWISHDIQALSDQAKLLALYLLTGPHTNMLGCFRVPVGYVAEDLQWGSETVLKRLGELFEKGFITHDKASGWLLIHNFLKWNPIENPNQGKSIKKLFEQIPQTSLVFPLVINLLHRNNKYLDKEFQNRLETLSQPFRNQEQNQEQDKNQEQKLKEMPSGISMLGLPNNLSLGDKNNSPDSVATTSYFKAASLKTQAIEVLQFLNAKTGRTYRSVDTNLKLIMARLKSGATVMDCRQVIAKKTREWKGDPKMVDYLRPATLFNATKFEQYLGELLPEEAAL